MRDGSKTSAGEPLQITEDILWHEFLLSPIGGGRDISHNRDILSHGRHQEKKGKLPRFVDSCAVGAEIDRRQLAECCLPARRMKSTDAALADGFE